VENIGVIVSPDHFVVQLLSRFGLSVAPALLDSDLPARGAPGSVSISWEQVQLLDADIIMLGFSNPELQQQFEESPLFGSLAAAQRGNFLTITSEMATALNVPSAGNILWTLDQLRDLFQQLDFIREA
ncbi:MAG: hypothetical protein KC438_14025, partial [Thermomicrobiales bacterium]|nr:hypothetical protein [Thermomicrobiales bacterium]